MSGLAYFVDPDSVERAITQLAQLHGITDEVRHGASVHDMSHQVTTEDQPRAAQDTPRPSAADRDNDALENQERQSLPQPDVSQYVARIESENVSLRDQIGVKDNPHKTPAPNAQTRNPASEAGFSLRKKRSNELD